PPRLAPRACVGRGRESRRGAGRPPGQSRRSTPGEGDRPSDFLLASESRPHASGGSVHPRLHPLCTEAEHSADLVERQIEVEVHEQDQSLAVGQPPHGALEVDALRCVLLRIRPLGVTARLSQPDDVPPAATAARSGFVGDDSQVPGAKARRIAPHLAYRAPGLEGRLLNGVFGLVPVPQDCPGDQGSRFDPRRDERLKRGKIACPGPVDQPTLQSHYPYNFGKRDVVAKQVRTKNGSSAGLLFRRGAWGKPTVSSRGANSN